MFGGTRKLREALIEAEARARHAEVALEKATERETYWRERYERLADQALFKTRDILVPVHEDVAAKRTTRDESRKQIFEALSVDVINEKSGSHPSQASKGA